MRNAEIKLELSLDEDLPTIFGDVIGIQQVVNNLVQNGVEALDGGGSLQISTQNGMSSFYENRPVVIMSVEDNGPGIAQDLEEKIFNPFFTTKSTGTGLGLSISHQIIERHGGVISCTSNQGQGTTFTVELPVEPKGLERKSSQ
jgi:signal transduction histidine kinase